jgi:hypothetical protein
MAVRKHNAFAAQKSTIHQLHSLRPVGVCASPKAIWVFYSDIALTEDTLFFSELGLRGPTK